MAAIGIEMTDREVVTINWGDLYSGARKNPLAENQQAVETAWQKYLDACEKLECGDCTPEDYERLKAALADAREAEAILHEAYRDLYEEITDPYCGDYIDSREMENVSRANDNQYGDATNMEVGEIMKRKLRQIDTCQHEWVEQTSGTIRLAAGEIDDNITTEIICQKCGAVKPETKGDDDDELPF